MARPKKVRLTPPGDTESQLREALQAQAASKIEQAQTFQPEVTVMPAEVKKEARKEHKTWNHHMHSDPEGLIKLIQDKWSKLEESDLVRINTEGNLVDVVAKRYQIPEEMAQATVSNWMKTL